MIFRKIFLNLCCYIRTVRSKFDEIGFENSNRDALWLMHMIETNTYKNMKTILVSLALIFSVSLFSQNSEPKFEREGDQVKGTYFHENGSVAQTGYFLDGKLNGEWKMYNEEGKKIAMGEYTAGKKTGKWFFWEGEGLKEVDYSNNKIANVIVWNNAESIAVNK